LQRSDKQEQKVSSKHLGVCPFCADNVTPHLIEKNTIRRDLCECPSCKEKLLICRTPGCHSYAKGGNNYDDELCPSCTSSLTSGIGEVLKYGAIAAATAIASAVVAKKTE
jgi:hypothetical protein